MTSHPWYNSSRRFPVGLVSLLTLIFHCFATAALASADWETLEGAKLVPNSYADGDSFKVKHQGKEYTFRLFFVDTPETDNRYPKRVQGQARAFHISATEALELGEEATDFSQDFLSGSFTVHTNWRDGWGEGQRFCAIIVKNDRELGAELVRNGLARVSGFVPESPWPGLRGTVSDYAKNLKRLQAEAQSQGKGGWGDSRLAAEDTVAGREDESTPRGIDINTASIDELDQLPGIGPVLAGRIAELRPFRSLIELDQVYGISGKTIEGFKGMAIVIPPPILPYTADYYRDKLRSYVNSPVRLTLSDLKALPEPAPEGFAVALALTTNNGQPGGDIRLFAPEEKMKNALARFRSTIEPLDVRAWLRDYEGEAILVIY